MSESARGAADREREQMLGWAREVLRLLEAHPKQLLRGFAAQSVTANASGRGWGELVVTLARGPETLRLFVVPRLAMTRAFRLTPSFAVSHADDTPADTRVKEAVIDVFARALERYVAARRAAPPGNE